jgi:hypothetical protein
MRGRKVAAKRSDKRGEERDSGKNDGERQPLIAKENRPFGLRFDGTGGGGGKRQQRCSERMEAPAGVSLEEIEHNEKKSVKDCEK